MDGAKYQQYYWEQNDVKHIKAQQRTGPYLGSAQQNKAHIMIFIHRGEGPFMSYKGGCPGHVGADVDTQ